jgi:hypothetical protein
VEGPSDDVARRERREERATSQRQTSSVSGNPLFTADDW